MQQPYSWNPFQVAHHFDSSEDHVSQVIQLNSQFNYVNTTFASCVESVEQINRLWIFYMIIEHNIGNFKGDHGKETLQFQISKLSE